MIVRVVDRGWQVVYHSTHGLLAMRIANDLKDAAALPYWFETRVAIVGHDDMLRVYEAGRRTHLTAAGAPRDFTLVPMRSDDRMLEMKRRIDQAYRKHSWIGLLQSMHADFLYSGEDVTDAMRQMLRSEAARRIKTLTALGADQADLVTSYQWMRFCDRLSLILCGDDVPAMSRRLEIITDASGVRYEIWRDSQDRLRIDPWPFAESSCRWSVQYRVVEQLTFDDDAQLDRHLGDAEVVTKRLCVSGAVSRPQSATTRGQADPDRGDAPAGQGRGNATG